MTSAVNGSWPLAAFAYDALGRSTGEWSQINGWTTFQNDAAGRRTRLTWPDGVFVDYDHLVNGEVTKVRENGATSGLGVLATFAYDDLGRRTSLTRGNGTVTSYAFDPVSRLASLTQNLSGTTNDLTITINGYNPASQIVSQTRSNDLYAWTGHGSGSTASVANGLNQLTSVGGAATAHDAKGNLTLDPVTGKTFGYDSENLLTSASGAPAGTYDALGRLFWSPWSFFAHDGVRIIFEGDGIVPIARRFVHGPGIDEPLVWYEGSGTSDRRFLHADERGSIVAVSDSAGNMLAINKYDEFGKPAAGNVGRFQYTGQAWLPELGVYYYKARMYAPHLPRFLQTDPIGYAGGPNLYAYVGNDPVNFADPLGLAGCVKAPGSNICASSFSSEGLAGMLAAAGHTSVFMPPDRLRSVNTSAPSSTLSGGPKAGEQWSGCCLSINDPGANASIILHGGLYDTNNVWQSVQFGSLPSSGPQLILAASGHNNPPRGLGHILRRGLGWIGTILSMGGDTCQTCIPSIDVTFSQHGSVHLEGTNLSQLEVEASIRADINQIFSQAFVAPPSGSFYGRLSIQGQTIVYRAHPLSSGRINVGTYYIPR